MGKLLPEMWRDRVSKLMQRDVAVGIWAMGIGRSAGTRDSTILEMIAWEAKPLESKGMVAEVGNTMQFERISQTMKEFIACGQYFNVVFNHVKYVTLQKKYNETLMMVLNDTCLSDRGTFQYNNLSIRKKIVVKLTRTTWNLVNKYLNLENTRKYLTQF